MRDRASSLTFMFRTYHIYDYTKANTNIMFIIFSVTSKGTTMEIRSTRSLNVIPATIIRGVFNLCFIKFAM